MKFVFIYCRARSGSYYVHSLFDGHPDVLSLPPLKSTRLFFHSSQTYWDEAGRPKLRTPELISEFVRSNPTLFDAIGRAGGQGYDRMGEDQNEALNVDPEKFSKRLDHILSADGTECTRRQFFVAAHQAYDFAVYGCVRRGNVIVYQAHNPLDDVGNEALLHDFPGAKLLLTVQEPVRSLVSLVYQRNEDEIDEIAESGRYLLCFKATVYGWRGLTKKIPRADQFITRMNVLNDSVELESRRYCEFAGIEWNNCMLSSTFNGSKWNGDNWSRVPVPPGLSATDVRIMRNKTVLYLRDELTLKVLCSDVSQVKPFHHLKVYHYFMAVIFMNMPMRVEVLGIFSALRRRSFAGISRATYFYIRRVQLSYAAYFSAILASKGSASEQRRTPG